MPLRHPLARYSLAIAAVTLTTWANFYIQALASNEVKPLPYVPVLIVITYYAGLLPALLFVVLASVALTYWWMEPIGSLHVAGTADMYVLVFFLLASSAIIAVSLAARRLVTNLRLQESRLRAAEAVLRESNRRKDEFLAILAHELRNPLAPIRYAGRMLKAPLTQDRMVHVSDMIERQLAHMTRLLDDLLDNSRVSRGVLELRLEPLDLRAAIEAAIDATRPSFENAGQTLLTRVSASPLPVDGDRVRLTQTLGNLLDNASKYSEPGTQIEIETRETAEEVIVEVRDHGIGISQELLPKVFELFTQGNHGTARAKGLGIGLALTQQLVTMHGGRIEAHSEGPGLGSRFVLTLPRRRGVPATPDPPLPAAVPDVRGVRILIADDNIDAAESLALILELAKHSPRVAHDGASALALAETFHPQIALLDIGLPDMTGLDLARQIRARSWGSSMRLIAVTGWGQESDRRKSTEAGFDEHLTKPVDPDQLLLRIAAYAAESQGAAPPCPGSAAASMT
jgi:signal transduction histidine kinase/ActR/RegA family two-component response regulator